MKYHLKTMDEVRAAVRAGREVFCGNTSYIVIEEDCFPEGHAARARQDNFSAVKDGKMLVSRCKSNWFGGCLEESQVAECFILIGEVL